MSLLVTGTIGLDDLHTPGGQATEVLGGSAVHFAFAAAFFTRVRFVGVVGDDFPARFRETLESINVDLTGLECRKGSKTFRWSGQYASEVADAQTLRVDLNVLAEAAPRVPPAFRDTPFVFVAATHPELQVDFVRQCTGPKLIVADTRDLWIRTERKALCRALGLVHGAILNDAEARLLTEESNLVLAGRRILDYGPRFVVIKKGESGALLVTSEWVFALPAYPTTQVRDPTGAGDSFAGGMMGYLAERGAWDERELRRALARGMITASFTIEDFGSHRMLRLTREEIERRLADYAAMMRFD